MVQETGTWETRGVAGAGPGWAGPRAGTGAGGGDGEGREREAEGTGQNEATSWKQGTVVTQTVSFNLRPVVLRACPIFPSQPLGANESEGPQV